MPGDLSALSACGGSMTTVCRRAFLGLTAAAAAMADSAKFEAAKARAAGLSSMTTGVQPITAQEHSARLAKVQTAMQQRKTAALLVEAGSTLEYFTGIHWWRSERTTAAVIPAEGKVVVVTPFFEEPSIRETLKVAGDVRTWKEDESPFDLIAGALRFRDRRATRRGSNHAALYRRTRDQGIGQQTRGGFGRGACPCLPDGQVSSGACFD